MTTQCPNNQCAATLQLPDSAAGQRISCNQCGMAFAIAGATSFVIFTTSSLDLWIGKE